MHLANTILVKRTDQGTGLFCVPEKLALRQANFLETLDAAIKASEKRIGEEKTDTIPIEVLLIRGMRDTFPCKKEIK
jgi:hypothetical protein